MNIYKNDESEIDPALLDTFAQQIEEMVEGIDGFLRKGREIGESDLYEAYRLAHRCKGDAQFLALTGVEEVANEMVHPLRLAHMQRRPLSPSERDALERALGVFREPS